MKTLIDLFFAIFKISKEASAKQGWANFGQKDRLFSLFSNSMKGCKGKYVYVVAEKEAAYRRLCCVNNKGEEVFKLFPGRGSFLIMTLMQ